MSARDFEPAFLSGTNWGLPPSCKVHRLANIAGTIEAGENCRIDAFVTVTGHLKMGSHCHLSTGSAVFAAYGVEMGKGCALSPGAKIFTATDDVDMTLLASFEGGLEPRGFKSGFVKLLDYVVVGANSVVLPSVFIGEEVQVGALSLVNRSLASHGVYVGAPARLLRARARLRY